MYVCVYRNIQCSHMFKKNSLFKRKLWVTVVQLLSQVTPFFHPMNCSMPVFLVLHYLWSLLKRMSIESVMLYSHLLCHPLLLLPSVFPRIRVFSSELALPIRWPKYWSFSISPASE